tara:strand:- start:814 stop:1014 length:201 start_codon:yes stop_codon:yes gene_type:complete
MRRNKKLKDLHERENLIALKEELIMAMRIDYEVHGHRELALGVPGIDAPRGTDGVNVLTVPNQAND